MLQISVNGKFTEKPEIYHIHDLLKLPISKSR